MCARAYVFCINICNNSLFSQISFSWKSLPAFVFLNNFDLEKVKMLFQSLSSIFLYCSLSFSSEILLISLTPCVVMDSLPSLVGIDQKTIYSPIGLFINQHNHTCL